MMSYGDPATQQWALAEDRAEPIVRQAAEAGVTFFDTADMYSEGVSEQITGRLLSRLFASRDDYVLATKVYYPMGPAQLGGWTRFVSMQNRYNLVNREDEREMLPFCLDQGIGILPYSPLARGLLAGTRVRTGEQSTVRGQAGDGTHLPADFEVADAVCAVAARRNLPPAQIAMAWLLGRSGVSAPIVGATKPGHIFDAIGALEVELSADEVAELESPYLLRLPQW
jgi:aryl-alcohol dehydrogenase-like predicted oxidoreductase